MNNTLKARSPRYVTARNMVLAMAACASMMYVAGVWAGQISSIKWRTKAKEPQVSIKLNKRPSSYDVKSSDGGRSLRLVLHDTTLRTSVKDLGNAGIVDSVFSYVATNSTSTNIDFRLSEPGRLEVSAGSREFRVRVRRDSGAKQQGAKASQGTKITGITHTKLPGGRIQLKIQMTGVPPRPKTFKINQPARISLDFPDVGSSLSSSSVRIKSGAVDNISVITSGGRTRVLLNLIELVPYRAQVAENAYVLILESPGRAALRRSERSASAARFGNTTGRGRYGIKDIDFSRSKGGAAKIVIHLSNPAVGVDIRESAGEIVVDFLDTAAAKALQRRLVVTDFGTPVQTIDTVTQGRNTRVIITPTGAYEHLAYQVGNTFTVNVKPLSQAQIDEKRRVRDQQKTYVGEKLSLNFQKIDVRDALQVLADFTGRNFVLSDAVSGNLTLVLKNVPWDQALDIILDTKGLGKREKGNVIIIAPAKELADKDKVVLEAKKTVRELEPLVSELIRISYAKASEIAELLKSVKAVGAPTGGTNPFQTVSYSGEQKISSNSLLSERGQVTVDERTNSILIQDTPSKIREVRALIAQLDQPVEQVMIEARLVEATTTFTSQLGSRFGATNAPVGGTTAVGGSLESTSAAVGVGVTPTASGLNVSMPAPGIDTAQAGRIALTLATAGELLQLELSALEQEGRGKLISSPRIITANQKKAVIEQGQERAFTTGAGQSETQTAVLKLEVTPQITPDRRIILDVLVTKDSFADVAAGLINKKKVQTNVLLDNGETVAIGGIYEQAKGTTVTQVPLFSRLPMLGWLFKKRVRLDEKTELLVFLTPRILSDRAKLR